MLALLNLGLSENDIGNILEINPQIIEVTEEEITNLINILKQVGCNNKNIKNIIISNPFYLSRIETDIINLITKLNTIGIPNLSILFENNPHFLNKDDFEIDNFIKEKKYTLEEFKNKIENNPYLIEEEEITLF